MKRHTSSAFWGQGQLLKWGCICAYSLKGILGLGGELMFLEMMFLSQQVVYAGRTFRIYSHSNFEVYDTVSSIIVTTLYIGSSELIHLIPGSLYLLTNISLFLPPPKSLTTTTLLFLWVWLFSILHISEMIQHLSFSVWLTSLNIIPSRSTHVVTNDRIFFFLLAK